MVKTTRLSVKFVGKLITLPTSAIIDKICNINLHKIITLIKVKALEEDSRHGMEDKIHRGLLTLALRISFLLEDLMFNNHRPMFNNHMPIFWHITVVTWLHYLVILYHQLVVAHQVCLLSHISLRMDIHLLKL